MLGVGSELGFLRCYAQHRLERAQAPVVVLLPREELPGELEDRHQLGGEGLRVLEALRVHHHFRDELVVRLGHGHRAEERGEVVGELGATAVALARRVHRDEDARVGVDLGRDAVHLARGVVALDGILDDLVRVRVRFGVRVRVMVRVRVRVRVLEDLDRL